MQNNFPSFVEWLAQRYSVSTDDKTNDQIVDECFDRFNERIDASESRMIGLADGRMIHVPTPRP